MIYPGYRCSLFFPLGVMVIGLAMCFPVTAGKTNKELVENGSFEKADGKDKMKPVSWDQPDGLGIQWLRVPPETGGKEHGKAIRMDTSISEIDMVKQWKEKGPEKWIFPNPKKNAIAATYGLSFYSESFTVTSGTTYRVSFDYMSEKGSSGAKVWVRGYGPLYNKRIGDFEKRRLYEKVVTCNSKSRRWKHFSEEFNPSKHRPSVAEMKVMLFAFWPPGVYWFDNISVTEAPAAE